MARDDVFRVRQTLVPHGEATSDQASISRAGFQLVTDFYTQLVLGGYAYHMQAGTEDAGINSTAAIDDELAWMVADNTAGNAMLPLTYECTPGVLAGATLVQAMLECDKGKARYTSGGTAFVPANLRSDDPNAANGSFFIVAGAGIVTAAKSAVPDSVELARQFYIEDALADSIGYPGAWNTLVYSIRNRAPCVLVDASSIVGHFGAATADVVGYGTLEFAQFPKTLVI